MSSPIREEAENFLRDILTGRGEIDRETLYKEAEEAGIKRPNLNKTARLLGIKMRRKEGIWYWSNEPPKWLQ